MGRESAGSASQITSPDRRQARTSCGLAGARVRRSHSWRRRTWVGVVSATLLLAVGCAADPKPPAPSGPVTLTIAFPQALVLDSQRRLEIGASEFERLTSYDASGRPTARLAERWAQSPDGLTWRLTLRPQARFRDGSPVTAALVKDALDALVGDPRYRGYYVCLEDVESVSAEGQRDIVIRLSRPCSYILEMLDIEVAKVSADGTRTGSGPFHLVSTKPGETVYESNRNYYDGSPAVDRVVLRGYATLREAWAGMMRGQLDVLMDVGPEGVDFLRDQTSVQTVSSVSLNAIAIALNSARPTLASRDVRRALNLAVNREELVQQALGGRGQTEDQPVWPAFWALGQGKPPVPFDPDEARRLLGGRRVSFTCLVTEGFTLWEKLALLVQRQFRAVGVDMKLEAITPAAMFTRLPKGDYDAALFDPIGGPYASIQHMFWHSPDPTPRNNVFNYRSADVDAALDAMRGAVDEGAFRTAMSRFLDAVREDPPAIFLVRPIRTQAVSRRFVLPPLAPGLDILRTVHQWTLKENGS